MEYSATATIPDAAILQVRAPSNLPGVYRGLLGHTRDDGRASAVRNGDDGLRPRRKIPRRARSERIVRRRLPPTPGAGVDARSLAQIDLTDDRNSTRRKRDETYRKLPLRRGRSGSRRRAGSD